MNNKVYLSGNKAVTRNGGRFREFSEVFYSRLLRLLDLREQESSHTNQLFDTGTFLLSWF